jgi:MYXO-CTERM domain-containing protein
MQLKSFITVGIAFAAIAVPVAQASNPLGHPGGPGSVGIVPAQSSYLGHPGGPTSVGLVPAKATSTSFRNFVGGPTSVGLVQGKPSSSNSYLGHVGGPGSVGLIQTATPSTSTGFAWDDAAIGAGFTAGLGLIAAGAFLATRRRATLAHSSS